MTEHAIGKRPRDADRERITAILDAALADGQINGLEHRERLSRVFQARTLERLETEIADLQRAEPIAVAETSATAASGEQHTPAPEPQRPESLPPIPRPLPPASPTASRAGQRAVVAVWSIVAVWCVLAVAILSAFVFLMIFVIRVIVSEDQPTKYRPTPTLDTPGWPTYAPIRPDSPEICLPDGSACFSIPTG